MQKAKRSIELKRPLCFFDVETTGVDPQKDRIITLAIVTLLPTGAMTIKNWKFNPTIPIPAASTEIHGITDDDVRTSPTFKEVYHLVELEFNGKDLAGYNILNFDIPILIEEFGRVDLAVAFPQPGTAIVDVYKIFCKQEKRDLANAVRFYTGEDITGAHDAEFDTLATLKVFKAQIEKYYEIPIMSPLEIQSWINDGKEMVDYAGKLTYNDKHEVIFNFGMNAGKRVIDKRDYASWMLSQNFPLDTKRKLKSILYSKP